MNKELFKNYAYVKDQIKVLTAEAKELEPKVVEEMGKDELEEVKSDWGTFSFQTRDTYTYPEYVTKAEENFKELKKKAESNGDATSVAKKSLRFTSK